MINDAEHIPLCLLAICMSSLELIDIQIKALKIWYMFIPNYFWKYVKRNKGSHMTLSIANYPSSEGWHSLDCQGQQQSPGWVGDN